VQMIFALHFYVQCLIVFRHCVQYNKNKHHIHFQDLDCTHFWLIVKRNSM
jgi:hypothetical protein